VHFDFGAILRRIAGGDAAAPPLAAADVAVVRRVLRENALLEDGTFPVARRILGAFVAEQRVGAHDRLVLNGLPRHTGQARDLAPLVRVRMVVYLECSVAVVAERIRRNVGGDRTHRCDDSDAAVAHKLHVFRQRTLPLLAHYRDHGAQIVRVPVTVRTTPEQMVASLSGEGQSS